VFPVPSPSLLTPPLAVWVHTPHPFLVQFWENFGIRYYGLAYLLGFVFGVLVFRRYHRAGLTPLKPAESMDLMLYLVIGVMVGGRLGSYLLYDGWRTFAQDPLGIFKVWQGGMASHGGFVGVVLALAWFARTHKVSFLHLGDLVTSAAPCGLFLGRIANYVNGELWGKATDGTWGVVFQGDPDRLARHPSQLYEAALEGLVLLIYCQWRFWRTDVARRQPGRLSGEFLLGYALARVVCEVFREPDASLLFGLSRGTFFSLFIGLGGIWLIWQSSRRRVA
jgi:phosphatidylglycerol:prolipoprotein diacylglycerol transferase